MYWIYLSIISLISTSCLPDAKGKVDKKYLQKLAARGSPTNNGNALCEHYYFFSEDTCHANRCPRGSHEADEEAMVIIKENFKRQIEEEELEEELVKRVQTNLKNARAVCIEGSGILRPDKAIIIKSDFCGCYNNSPITLGQCSFFCDGLNVSSDRRDLETLYGSVLLRPEVELHRELGNLHGWCHNDITGSDYQGPGCQFIAESNSGSDYALPITVYENNTFTADISGIPKDQTYIGKIVEVNSGSYVSSNNIQFRLVDAPEETEIPIGPLKILPISQYTCVVRPNSRYSPSLDEAHYNDAFKLHFYFMSSNSPPYLKESQINNGVMFCHDVEHYGLKDSPRRERLELIPQHFALWDLSDTRFLNGNNETLDINDALSQRLAQKFGIRRQFNLFAPLTARSNPSAENASVLGHIMNFWTRRNSTETFCPKQHDYNGNNPIFRVLKDYIGIDTEGIYIATNNSDNGSGTSQVPPDLLYIREGQLKEIWFVIEDGKLLRPNESNLDSKDIMFYWPPDPYAPYTKKDNQELYTLINSTTPNTFSSSDKKIGCIPVSD